MVTVPTTPQGIGGILDTGIKLFISTLKTMLPIAFIGGLVINLPALVMRLPGFAMDPTADPEVVAAAAGPFVILTLAASILSLAFYNAVLLKIDATVKGAEMSVGEAFTQGLRRFPAALGTGILYMLAVVLGMVLLIIPGLILSIYLYCAVLLAVIDRCGPIEAIKRSYNITKGSWWRVATILTVAIIIVFVVALLITVLLGAIGVVSGGLSGDLAAMTTAPLWVDLLLVPLTNGIYIVLMSCILYAVAADLKLRYEGSDLLARAESL
jgi:hypothetical protein